MQVKEISRNVHFFNFAESFPFSLEMLMMSDVHFDSIKCDRKLLKKHFDEAKAKNALVFIFGDWFDLMQGRYDPRRNYTDMREEYRHSESYYDTVIQDSVNFLSEYIDVLAFISYGNHETSIVKHNQTDPLERLVWGLKTKHPNCILQKGAYSGWLKFSVTQKKGNGNMSYLVKYHHGQRSNAQRSKGILQVDMDAMKWPDVDLIVKGDDHMRWFYPSVVRNTLNQVGQIQQSIQRHIRLGSYKDGLGDEAFGWEVEKAFAQTSLGGWWVTLTRSKYRIDTEIKEAI
jgi:hypothetical protein